MKDFWKFLIYILVMTAPISCKEKGDASAKQYNGISTLEFPIEIDLEGLIGKEIEENRLSTVVDSIEYIPLETTEGSLIGLFQQAVIADSFIFILTENKILKFSREGKYLHQIGSLGRGPGQFLGIRNISIDDLHETLFIYPNRTWRIIKYTYNNEFIGEQQLFPSYLDLASTISFIGKNRFSAAGCWMPAEWITKEMFIAAILDSSG